MSKLKFHFKLQGLELDIEGTREDIPAISQGIGAQIANLIESTGKTLSPSLQQKPANDPPLDISPPDQKKKPRRKRVLSAGTGEVEVQGAEAALTWQHDPAKFGSPNQSWNTATKAIWLLYVVKEVLQRNEMTAKTISETFNKSFRQTGEIKSFNVTRDLGKAKNKGKSAPVAENNAKNPSEWYLTDAGIKEAQALISNANP